MNVFKVMFNDQYNFSFSQQLGFTKQKLKEKLKEKCEGMHVALSRYKAKLLIIISVNLVYIIVL